MTIGIQPKQLWLIALMGSASGGLAAALLGFSPDWDLYNYHLYNPHALLHGRLDLDIAPAQLQGFINPLFHVPFYLLFVHFGPSILVFITGAIQGLQWVVLGLLLMRLLPVERVPAWMAWSVAALGLCGPIFVFELGGAHGDTIISMLILLALLVALPHPSEAGSDNQSSRAWLAGLLTGLATALKLTMAVYAVGLVIAIMLCRPFEATFKTAVRLALANAAGFLLGGIAWFGWLWLSYDNPLFPYFNQLFQSEWASTASFRDRRFLPSGSLEWLVFPWVWLNEDYRVWEFRFRDFRLLLLYPLMFLFPLLAWRKSGREAPGLRMLLVFLAASYCLWLPLFSIYRYLSVIELLAPLALFAALLWLGRTPRTTTLAFIFLVATQLSVGYSRPDANPGLRISQPSLLRELDHDSMLLISGYEPIAYAALWLDDDIPLVRIRSNFLRPDTGNLNRELGGNRLSQLATSRIAAHPGPLYLLQSPAEGAKPFLAGDLLRLGLEHNVPERCLPAFEDAALQRILRLELCPLRRTSGT